MVDNLNLFKLIRFIETKIGVEFERNEDSLTIFDLLESKHDAIRNFLAKNNLWNKRINEKIRDLKAKKRISEYNVEDKYVEAYLYDHFEHLNLIKDKYDSYRRIS